MPEKKGARLDFDERWEIEDMLKESSPFREIARKLGVVAHDGVERGEAQQGVLQAQGDAESNSSQASQQRFMPQRLQVAGCGMGGACGTKRNLVAVPVLRAARLRLRLRLKAARVRAVRLREVQKARRTAPSRRCSTSPLAPRRLTTRACAAYAGIACEPS